MSTITRKTEVQDNLLDKVKGFTIIEVVLVLAIAGLIFLIVFLALPGLQRVRRDTQRKSDAQKILSSAENYASNNGGVYPCSETSSGSCNTNGVTLPSWTNFNNNYLAINNLKDPSGSDYMTRAYTKLINNPTFTDDWSSFQTVRTIVIIGGGFCNNGTAGARSTSPSTDFAVWIKLETGSYCVSNNKDS